MIQENENLNAVKEAPTPKRTERSGVPLGEPEMTGKNTASTFELVIRARHGWQALDVREMWIFRELLGFLIWRDVKIRYRQTALGGLWAILQPLLGMLIFTVFFNRIAGIQSDGPPYPLFVYAGLVPWFFFSNAVSSASNSLIGNQQLLSKIYFPRMFIPMGSIGAFGMDLLVSLGLTFGLMAYYRQPPPVAILLLPILILACFLAACGLGLFMAALSVRYRDVKYAIPFFIQMLFFVTPIIYPPRYVPGRYQVLLGLNPMTGIVMGFRYALLGTPGRWDVAVASGLVSVVMFVAGLLIFRRMERVFADIV